MVEAKTPRDLLYEAIGTAIVKSSDLEVCVAEFAIHRLIESGDDESDARDTISGKSGKSLRDALAKLGEPDVGDRYLALCEERNQVVHGVWWDIFDDGTAVVVRQPKKLKGKPLGEPISEEWTRDRLRDLARRSSDLEHELMNELYSAGRVPQAFTITWEREYKP